MSERNCKKLVEAYRKNKKLFAVLVDPEKCNGEKLSSFIKLINKAKPDFIFIGGSQIKESIDNTVSYIKHRTDIPIILFIGDSAQFSPKADAMLFLSLISGRNPDFLIGQHIKSARKIKQSGIKTFSTGYILISGGCKTSVEKASKTKAIYDINTIVDTAIAGEFLGQQLIYLEAGSGAKVPVSKEIIRATRENISIPIIVGGGITSTEMIKNAIDAGADIIVVGNHLEKNSKDIIPFAEAIKEYNK